MARKQSNFTKLANKITAQYLDKGFSREEAEKIGKATAYKIGVRKYGKASMAKRAAAGRKRAEGTEVMWDEDEWVLVKDNTVADVIADEYLDMGEDYDDSEEWARRASKKMSAETCDLCSNPAVKESYDLTEGMDLCMDCLDEAIEVGAAAEFGVESVGVGDVVAVPAAFSGGEDG